MWSARLKVENIFILQSWCSLYDEDVERVGSMDLKGLPWSIILLFSCFLDMMVAWMGITGDSFVLRCENSNVYDKQRYVKFSSEVDWNILI